MGAVFRGVQVDTGREVAIKVLSAKLCGQTVLVQRFFREANILASIEHPHVVPVYDYGHEQGIYYIVMPYICSQDGRRRTVSDWVRSEGGLEFDVVLRVMEQTCLALGHVHKLGIIHRDIKPGNLLIDDHGDVRLADFGIAHYRSFLRDSTLTFQGATLGSLRYISPEQRDNPGRVDRRADLFSLGKVFYKMLTGQVPEGKYPAASSLRPDIDERVDRVIDKALMQDPDGRFASAEAFGDAIVSLKRVTQPTPSAPLHMTGSLAGLSSVVLFVAAVVAYSSVLMNFFRWPIAVTLILAFALVLAQYARDVTTGHCDNPAAASA